jgi:UDP-glucuronate 4-epimerase
MVSDKKILFTGATGCALRPAAEAMAADNEVWCLGRFTDPAIEAELAAKGIRTAVWSMGEGPVRGIDDDFTHVVHGADPRGLGWHDFDASVQVRAAAAGSLMHHCRKAESFIFVSTFGVYARVPTPGQEVAEDYPLGGYTPFAPTYGVSKIAAEGAVRAFASVLGLPTTIARCNVVYSPTGGGGLPASYFGRLLNGEPIGLPDEARDVPCSPISADDITNFCEGLWDIARPAATIVNLAGDETTSVVEFMRQLGARAELPVRFVPDDLAPQTKVSDNTRRRELLGDCTVRWREGMPRAVAAHYPGAFAPA